MAFLDQGGRESGRCRCVGTLNLVMQLTPHPPSALQTEGTDGRAPRRGLGPTDLLPDRGKVFPGLHLLREL